MVQIVKNGDKSITVAWVLNIAILVITGLTTLGVANLTWQFTMAMARIERIENNDHAQDLCMKELKLNQDMRLQGK